ncbi:MAG: hypothetical protein ACI91R_000585 [Vicingaceae bacterium]|jgi:hypothetical protein
MGLEDWIKVLNLWCGVVWCGSGGLIELQTFFLTSLHLDLWPLFNFNVEKRNNDRSLFTLIVFTKPSIFQAHLWFSAMKGKTVQVSRKKPYYDLNELDDTVHELSHTQCTS